MDVVGGVSAIAGLVEQSFKLLDRVQMALDHNKEYAMHLAAVSRDIEGIKSIVQQVENNPMLQTDPIQPTMGAILGVAKKLDDLVTTQETKTKNGAGFRLFAHSFAKGPKEQKQLEKLRDELMQHKNTLILCIVVNIAPSGTTLSVKGVKMDGEAIMQNGRVIRTSEDRDFDNITINDVVMAGCAFMNNSSVLPEEQAKLLEEPFKRAKMQNLLQLVANPAVPEEIKRQTLDIVTKL